MVPVLWLKRPEHICWYRSANDEHDLYVQPGRLRGSYLDCVARPFSLISQFPPPFPSLLKEMLRAGGSDDSGVG